MWTIFQQIILQWKNNSTQTTHTKTQTHTNTKTPTQTHKKQAEKHTQNLKQHSKT